MIELPRPSHRDGNGDGDGNGPVVRPDGVYEYLGPDVIATVKEETIGLQGMKIDRMYFDRFAEAVRADRLITTAVEAGQWDRVIDHVNREVFDKPEEFYTLAKLRQAAAVDRRLTLREILEHALGLVPRLKSKDELLEEEFAKFVVEHTPRRPASIPAIKNYFKAYAADGYVRHVIDQRRFAGLATHASFSTGDLRQVPERFRDLVPQYIRDYISLNQFMA